MGYFIGSSACVSGLSVPIKLRRSFWLAATRSDAFFLIIDGRSLRPDVRYAASVAAFSIDTRALDLDVSRRRGCLSEPESRSREPLNVDCRLPHGPLTICNLADRASRASQPSQHVDIITLQMALHAMARVHEDGASEALQDGGCISFLRINLPTPPVPVHNSPFVNGRTRLGRERIEGGYVELGQ